MAARRWTTFPVHAVNADGTPHALPRVVLTRGARRLVLRREDTLIVMKGDISHKEFWAVDLQTGHERQLTSLRRGPVIGDFDLTPDGGAIIFDRTREESDVVLFDLSRDESRASSARARDTATSARPPS